MGSALPSKEQQQFRQLVRCYETKQFKKALRTADVILKKVPDHGETLAMKGLVLNALERKDEAYELVREGLKHDPWSHVCWHVYGLLYRSDREYVEASRAYQQALKIDNDNVQILRDLALLQIQIRHFEGFSSARRTLLTLKPGQKNNWIAFALSHHLQGNYREAVRVLDTYQSTIVPSDDADGPYEKSELQMYRNHILEESGDVEGALQHLQRIESAVVDRTAWLDAEARLLLALGRYEEAGAAAQRLLERNSENAVYLGQFQEAVMKLENTADEARLTRTFELCDEIAAQYPRALQPRRTPLDLIEEGSDEFSARLDAYVRWFLVRGVPSLNADLKSLYANDGKVSAIESLFLGYEKSLQEDGTLPPPRRAADVADTGAEESGPSTRFWVLLFLAQHYDRVGSLERAAEYVERSIEHTPTVIEAYQVKARILKHSGDLTEAAKVADEARRMDLADRNLNTKCAKYQLRCDMVEAAEANMALFTRDGESRGAQALYDMQCMWYECEAGESFLRQKGFARSLKYFTAVDRHFADFMEDQFDFHTYCIRKETMRSYVSLLRMEDEVKSSSFFVRAAKGLVQLHLYLHDNPTSRDGGAEVAESLANLSVSERKKALSKMRKAQAKKQRQQQVQDDSKKKKVEKNGKTDVKKGKSAGTGWMEVDREGTELLKNIKDHLHSARKYVIELERYARNKSDTHSLAFEVAMRQGKYLMALRALRRAFKLEETSPEVLSLLARTAREIEGDSKVMASMSPSVREVISTEGTRKLLQGTTVPEYIERCMSSDAADARTRFGGGIALLRCAGGGDTGATRERALELLTNTDGASYRLCERVSRDLGAMGCVEEQRQFVAAAVAKFPRGAAFQSAAPAPAVA